MTRFNLNLGLMTGNEKKIQACVLWSKSRITKAMVYSMQVSGTLGK